MSPSDVKTQRDVLSLKETIKDFAWGYISIQHDGNVHITQQRNGEPPKASVEIPRHIFQKFIEWYDKPQ